ncbi:hypothetical protein HOY80DRAFT_63434 [Tuber brumale]|nr:hypothetical protein HOY80DRAFT_63434 [Tuber brumale]
MNTSTEHKPRQESRSATPLSFDPHTYSSPTPVTAERLSALGPSTIPTKTQAGSQLNSDEPTKRNGLPSGSAVRDGNKKNGDRDGDISQPLDLGGGKPPIDYDRLIRTGNEGQGAWWRCKIRHCLAVVPDAHTIQGRAVIRDHVKEHCLTIDHRGSGPDEVPGASDTRTFSIGSKV